MANNGNFLNLEDGKTKSDLAIESRSGVGDASKIIRTDSNGYIDNSFLNIGDAPCFDVYNTVPGANVNSTTYVDVIFDAIRESDTSFSYSTITGEMTANVTGKFLVSVDIGIEQNAGNNRATARTKLQIDTGGGYADIPGCQGNIYTRQTANGEGGVTLSFIWNTSPGEKIKAQLQRENGNITIRTRANSCRMVVTGLQGPTGSQGPAGSIGSSGAIGEVQLSDGIGGLNSSPNFTYGSDTLVIQSVSNNDAIDLRNNGGTTKLGFENGYPALADRIAHLGDTNTYINFSDDQIDFLAGGQNFMRMDEAGQDVITFNINNNDVDFVIDKNGTGQALDYDAGLDTFTISSDTTFSPNVNIDGTLFVYPTGDINDPALEVRSVGGDNWVTIWCPDATTTANFFIFDSSGFEKFHLEYIEATDTMNLFTPDGFVHTTGSNVVTYSGTQTTFGSLTEHKAIKGTVFRTTISESIDASLFTSIRQNTSGISTTLTGAVDGSRIRIHNASGGDCTIVGTVNGSVNPIIKDRETWDMEYHATESEWTV